ncbi:MAG: phosphoglycerate dehydrogenase [Candidatus Omnitrophota bacterium]
MKILVADALGKGGMEILRKDKAVKVDEKVGLKPEELKKIVADYDAIIVRSSTKLTKDILEKATRLKVVGRAGVGVDNVDLETATKRGVIVMNTPGGNTISTAEHTFSMMMALARNIPQACQSLKSGKWDRKSFTGTELCGKVLGIVGYGRIGREVAKRALAFSMQVLVFDPFISPDSFKDHPVEFTDVKSLLKRADFITVHTPLTPETKYILGGENLKLCKKNVRIINCARGGIVSEADLVAALEAGTVTGAALDVFEEEPTQNTKLVGLPQVIATPHLGAATQEAQENVALDIAVQVLDALKDRAILNAVNLPNLDPETLKVIKPWTSLAEKIGSLYMQLFGGTIKKVTIRYGGEVANYSLQPMTLAMLKGLLTPICGESVNFVNAQSIAKERGIAVNESRSTQIEDFTNYIELEVADGGKTHRVMGTLFENKKPRIVRIDEFSIDVEPIGTVVWIQNHDRPGVVGTLGTILGKKDINIAEMSLGRMMKGNKMVAMTVINTDSDVPAAVLTQIKKFDPIIDAKVVKL